jgi:formamidopyrimidine-DNA glycosylase
MPELPEVETIRREVLPFVRGKTVTGVEIIDHRNIKGMAPAEFQKKMKGQKILDIERKAKYQLFKLASGNYMVVHLGMTGRLLFSPDKYVKVIFNLSGGKKLYFSDARLFGKLWFYESYPPLKLGPEPLDKDFTWQKLKALFSKRRTSIKVIMLDQKILSGVGNIYANEALFRAGIDPRRKANRLSDAEYKRLHKALTEVLNEAIRYRGTSDSWYVDAKGQQGSFQHRLKVYGRKGEPCVKCKGKVVRISHGQRGTFFCPRCQK